MASLQSTISKIKYYCAYQERSHKEVREKLLELGEYGADLEDTIALLIAENYLNEERFAILFAGSKFRQLHWGKVKILQGLKSHNISAYCIKKAILEIHDDDYFATLQKLIEKKTQELSRERDSIKKKNKIKNYLLQKGFELHLILEKL